MKETRLNHIVQKVRGMPVLPSRVNKIIEITEDPDSTIEVWKKKY